MGRYSCWWISVQFAGKLPRAVLHERGRWLGHFGGWLSGWSGVLKSTAINYGYFESEVSAWENSSGITSSAR